MKPEISIILPSIRNEKLLGVYTSILDSTKRSFELIIIGPNQLPVELQNKSEIVYISSFASPIVASQIGAELARGEIFLWSADDAIFLPNALDESIELLRSMGDNYKNVVVAKYYEGSEAVKPLQPDAYFKINNTPWTSSPHAKDDWWIFNVAIMYRKFFEELGGWDTGYQSCPLSHTNLAMRAYIAGANVQMANNPLLNCDHGQNDHFPIEHSMHEHDSPRYNWQFKGEKINAEIVIPFDSWKDQPEIWTRRFTT